MSNVRQIQSHQFDQEVLRASEPVLVDFFATWCPPCRVIGPILDRLSQEFAGQIKFLKINVDEAPDLAYRYGITGIPTLILFHNGQIVDTLVGLLPPDALRQRLNSVLTPHRQDT